MESNDNAYFEAGQHSYVYSGLIDTVHTFEELREKLKKHKTSALGFLSYDAVRLFEAIPDRHKGPNQLPEIHFNFYKDILKFDRQRQKAELTSSTASITTDLSDEEFMSLVEQAKNHIINGDIFQVVLSRKFTTPYSVSPMHIYETLKKISPAPYMFYLPTEHGVMVGASPEKLISVINKKVEINPIAGTRPRTQDKTDDQIAADLLGDKKEVAEHMMLVDLARNDIGASCKPGSVKIKELSKIKHFSHVSHIASTVTGELRDDKDALDALAAAFPAGTLSGAPKIRAMEIIDELETSRRGIYGGAIVQIDAEGNLDSCIAIRMAVLKNGIATVRTGAGIVYDSNPLSEANETRQKARGILEAIATAERTFA